MCFSCFSRSKRRKAAKQKLKKDALKEAAKDGPYHSINDEGLDEVDEKKESMELADRRRVVAPVAPYGRIKLKLDYDYVQNILISHVICCEGIPAADLSGTSDPYVKAYIKPAKKKKFETKIKRKTLNPVFNETFNFKVPYNELPSSIAVFALYDFDRMTKDDRLGQVAIPLSSVDFGGIREEEWRILEAPLEESTEARLGDICFSLRYNEKTGKLTITVLEARNLKKMDVGGYSDPYVKLEIYENGRRLKKKKTAVKFQSLSPYYNESFQFIIPMEQLMEIDVVISVWDYDRLSSNDFIGQVVLGAPADSARAQGRRMESSALGLKHFQEMLKGRRPIAKWHTLQPHDEADDAASSACTQS